MVETSVLLAKGVAHSSPPKTKRLWVEYPAQRKMKQLAAITFWLFLWSFRGGEVSSTVSFVRLRQIGSNPVMGRYERCGQRSCFDLAFTIIVIRSGSRFGPTI